MGVSGIGVTAYTENKIKYKQNKSPYFKAEAHRTQCRLRDGENNYTKRSSTALEASGVQIMLQLLCFSPTSPFARNQVVSSAGPGMDSPAN